MDSGADQKKWNVAEGSSSKYTVLSQNIQLWTLSHLCLFNKQKTKEKKQKENSNRDVDLQSSVCFEQRGCVAGVRPAEIRHQNRLLGCFICTWKLEITEF